MSEDRPQGSEVREALNLYRMACDLCDEIGAADTILGRPEVARRKAAALRDAIGALPAAAPVPPAQGQATPSPEQGEAAEPKAQDAVSSIDYAQQVGYLGSPAEWREACRLFRVRCSPDDVAMMSKMRTYIEDGLLQVSRPAEPKAQAPSADALAAALHAIIRFADKSKEPCGMDPESPAAIRNGKFATIAQMAAQGLGLVQGPPFAEPKAQAQAAELSKEDIAYPADVFRALLSGNSPYAFYLFQWVRYQTDAKRWRLKMQHDVRTFDGREAFNIWPNASSCGPFRDDEVEFIRISKSQFGNEWEDPRPDRPGIADAPSQAQAGGVREALAQLLAVQGCEHLSDLQLTLRAQQGDAFSNAVIKARKALSTPSPEARETAEPIGFITEEALRLLRDPEWLAQRGTYANLWGTDGPPNRAIVPVFAAPVSQPEALPLKSMNWHPGPIKTEWGDGMLVADVELSPDQTLTMFIHKNALPLLKDKP